MKGYQVLSEKRCGNCNYFRKHYIRLYEGCYLPTDYGHCVHPRLKNRRAEEHCSYWKPIDEKDPRSL